MEGIVFQLLSKLGGNLNKDTGVVLTPGQIINVYVKQILGDQALLSYGNKTILAQLETPAEEGARLRCIVQGEKEGKLLLKLLIDGETPPQKPKTLISELLKNANVPESEFSRAVIESMLKQDVPVSKETVENILKAMQKFQLPVKDTDLPVFLFKHGLPLSKDIMTVLQQPPGKPDSLGRQLADLKEFLVKLINSNDFKKVSNTESGKLIEKIVTLLNKMTSRSGEESYITAHRIALSDSNFKPTGNNVLLSSNSALGSSLVPGNMESAKNIGSLTLGNNLVSQHNASTNGDAARFQNIKEGNQRIWKFSNDLIDERPRVTGAEIKGQQGEDGNRLWLREQAVNKDLGGKGVQAEIESGHSKVQSDLEKEIIPRLVKLVESQEVHGKNEFITRLREIIGGYRKIFGEEKHEKLTELLNRLQKALEEEPLLDKSDQITKELSGKVSEIVDKLNIYQQINKGEQGQDNIFLLQSLANPENPAGAYEVLIKINKEKSEKPLNYNDCQIVVSLNTLNYGLIKAHAQVKGKQINCRFLVENEQVKSTVDRRVNKLQYCLEAVGFKINIQPTEIIGEQDSVLNQIIEDKNNLPSINQIDVRI